MQVTDKHKRRVLILEHDAATRQILGSSLQRAGFEVIEASASEEVHRVALLSQPDVILVDAKPQDLSAAHLRERLRQVGTTRHIPVLLLIDRSEEENVRLLLGGPFDYITKPFDPNAIVAHVKSCVPDLPYQMDVNPFTDLPGSRWLEQEMVERLARTTSFTLVNIDINSLRPYSRVYGQVRAANAIRLLAQVLEESVKLFGNGGDFVGHVGDDDFYVLTTPDKAHSLCLRIISRFNHEVTSLYTLLDAARGQLECEFPPGYVRRHPLMSLSIGMTTSSNVAGAQPAILRRIATEIRDHARSTPGSSFYFDETENHLVLDGPMGKGRRQARPATSRKTTAQGQQEGVEFARFVTNKLRVPVTVIQSTLDFIGQTRKSSLDAEQTRHFEVLNKHVHHLAEAISQLATYYQLSHGDTAAQFRGVDVSRFVAQVGRAVEITAKERMVSLLLPDEKSARRIVIDEEKMCSALLYTLNSVLNLAPPGARMQIDFDETESLVTLNISIDRLALGMPELTKAFQTLHRSRKPSGPDPGDLGLGLCLARQLVESAGGTVALRRRNGFHIGLAFPRRPRTIGDQGRQIQGEIAAARTRAEEVAGRLRTLAVNGEMPRDEVETLLDRLVAAIEHLDLEATRAVRLADEAMVQVSKGRERLNALDAVSLTFLEATIRLVEQRDCFFAGHSRRVALQAFSIGRELSLPPDELQILYHTGLLHDLGMAAVPEAIVNKVEALTDAEWHILKQHPVDGSRAISSLEALLPLAQPVLHHHESFDGTGYPLGLKGEAIPLAARILAVADTFDALTSSRPFRPPLPAMMAIKKIVGAQGTHFDPRVVEAIIRLNSLI